MPETSDETIRNLVIALNDSNLDVNTRTWERQNDTLVDRLRDAGFEEFASDLAAASSVHTHRAACSEAATNLYRLLS